MKSITYTITDELGIHARPAGLLVKLAGGFQRKIRGKVVARVERRGK